MEIPNQHKAALFNANESARIRFFQEWWDGLKVDGIYGEKTAAALDEYIAGKLPETKPRMEKAFWSAIADVGVIEQPIRSNSGPEIDGWRIEIDLPQLGRGQWCALFQSVHCTRSGIIIKSRGATGIVNEMIALPRGRRVDIADIGEGFFGMCARKRGRKLHHVQMFRAFMTGQGLRIHHVGGNEKHMVKSAIWKPAKFFKGVTKVATYE